MWLGDHIGKGAAAVAAIRRYKRYRLLAVGAWNDDVQRPRPAGAGEGPDLHRQIRKGKFFPVVFRLHDESNIYSRGRGSDIQHSGERAVVPAGIRRNGNSAKPGAGTIGRQHVQVCLAELAAVVDPHADRLPVARQWAQGDGQVAVLERSVVEVAGHQVERIAKSAGRLKVNRKEVAAVVVAIQRIQLNVGDTAGAAGIIKENINTAERIGRRRRQAHRQLVEILAGIGHFHHNEIIDINSRHGEVGNIGGNGEDIADGCAFHSQPGAVEPGIIASDVLDQAGRLQGAVVATVDRIGDEQVAAGCSRLGVNGNRMGRAVTGVNAHVDGQAGGGKAANLHSIDADEKQKGQVGRVWE